MVTASVFAGSAGRWANNFMIFFSCLLVFQLQNQPQHVLCRALELAARNALRLSQRFQIGRRPTLTFTDEDAPMDTLADLQALLDRIYETDGTSSSVTIESGTRNVISFISSDAL